MKVKCVKCGKNGSLTMKTTVSKVKGVSYSYRYFYVEHSVKGKKSWCFVGKELPKEYAPTSTVYTKHTQKYTQRKKPNLNPVSPKRASGGIRTRDLQLTRLSL